MSNAEKRQKKAAAATTTTTTTTTTTVGATATNQCRFMLARDGHHSMSQKQVPAPSPSSVPPSSSLSSDALAPFRHSSFPSLVTDLLASCVMQTLLFSSPALSAGLSVFHASVVVVAAVVVNQDNK